MIEHTFCIGIELIQFKQVTLARGTKVLFQGASFQLHPGHKVGLTGANGVGKSSLFAMLRAELSIDSGTLEMPANWVIAHVSQETPALETPALAFVLSGDEEYSELSQQMAKAEANDDGGKLAELHQRLADIDGYRAESRAASLLSGLGFTQDNMQQAVASFSGGWRVRLNIARALMCRSDLLLLDEPTNHLDLDAVIWLERWLQSYQGTLFLISHDRDFLDAVVNHIAHIEQQTFTLYKGGYSDFERQRAEKLALQQAMYEKQQRKISHLAGYIDRFRAKATKAKQAQSRIKALERMEMISAAHFDSPFNFNFLPPEAVSDPLLSYQHAAVGYADTAILQNVELTIRPGERIGLLGQNGAGKSTLIKLLANELTLLAGERSAGKSLKIGYFAQHQLEQLRPEESPLQHLLRLDSTAKEQDALNYLGGFAFAGEMAKTACENFSGGEKSRLALALLIWSRPNLLLLDEPTNHLDLEMRHALAMALQSYEGGLVLVSHDRALLRAACDQFVLVADGKASTFDGDLSDYKNWLDASKAKVQTDIQTETEADTVVSHKAQRAAQKEARQARLAARRPLLKAVAALDKTLEALQAEKLVLDERLADPSVYEESDKTELQAWLKQQAALAEQIETTELEWLALHEQLEALPEIS